MRVKLKYLAVMTAYIECESWWRPDARGPSGGEWRGCFFGHVLAALIAYALINENKYYDGCAYKRNKFESVFQALLPCIENMHLQHIWGFPLIDSATPRGHWALPNVLRVADSPRRLCLNALMSLFSLTSHCKPIRVPEPVQKILAKAARRLIR